MRIPALLLEAVTLQSARGRVLTFSVLSLTIYCCHYHWLDHLSLWGDLGIKSAPSIGLTRAYWLLLHGQPHAAWHRNPLIYLVLGVGLPLISRDALKLYSRRVQSYPQAIS